MKKYKVFIDGESGTTGLQIRQRLQNHAHIDVVSIDYEKRRDNEEKLKILSQVDVTILCLPDDAAKEAATLVEQSDTGVRVLDASSAHRTADGWVYGMPELCGDQRSLIQQAQKVSNPGCYATGAIMLLRPLVEADLLNGQALVSLNAVSGYSGGGKNLIQAYEEEGHVPTVGLYGLNLAHKHTPEIQKWAHLARRPIFIPSVASFDQGMLVHSQFDMSGFSQSISADGLVDMYRQYYADEPVVTVHTANSIEDTYAPYLSPHGISGQNKLELHIYASEEWQQAMVVAKLDNLGKGASGAAVQNLNVMLGLPESEAVEL